MFYSDTPVENIWIFQTDNQDLPLLDGLLYIELLLWINKHVILTETFKMTKHYVCIQAEDVTLQIKKTETLLYQYIHS